MAIDEVWKFDVATAALALAGFALVRVAIHRYAYDRYPHADKLLALVSAMAVGALITACAAMALDHQQRGELPGWLKAVRGAAVAVSILMLGPAALSWGGESEDGLFLTGRKYQGLVDGGNPHPLDTLIELRGTMQAGFVALGCLGIIAAFGSAPAGDTDAILGGTQTATAALAWVGFAVLAVWALRAYWQYFVWAESIAMDGWLATGGSVALTLAALVAAGSLGVHLAGDDGDAPPTTIAALPLLAGAAAVHMRSALKSEQAAASGAVWSLVGLALAAAGAGVVTAEVAAT